MALQKVTIAIHPVIAECRPKLLAYLMTLDHYCLPLRVDKGRHYPGKRGKGYELGPACCLYFRKILTKERLRELNQLPFPKGIYIHFGNTYDNPCLIQNGHSPEYAVQLHSLKEIQNILQTTLNQLK